MSSEVPWKISDAAVEDFCDATNRDPEDVATFCRAKMQLVERLRSPMRFRKVLNSGCQLWRFAEKPRMYLVVDLQTHTLTSIRPEHRRKS